MKGYVVTLMNLSESIAVANRCIDSGKKFGVDVELFAAVWKDIALDELSKEGLKLGKWDESFSNTDAVVGNFIAQYRIWKKIVESNQPGIVLEHDAIFIANVPDLENKGDIINLGFPSYGRYISKSTSGIYPMFSKTGGYIPGAHGYYVTPIGAKELIAKAKTLGAWPCDLFLNKRHFPNIKEAYPWIIKADDSFTTIQKRKGCAAKHNYNDDYKLV